MTETVDKFQVYLDRTEQMWRQRAGLELVLHIRGVIYSEYMRRTFKGDYNDALYLHLRSFGVLFGQCRALRYVLDNKTLDEQKRILNEMLSPLVVAGDMPAYSLRETDAQDDERHIVIDYEYPL